MVELCIRLAWSSGKAKQSFHPEPICFLQHLGRIPPATSVIPCSNTRDMALAHERLSLTFNTTLMEFKTFSSAASEKAVVYFFLSSSFLIILNVRCCIPVRGRSQPWNADWTSDMETKGMGKDMHWPDQSG